jgi:putative FmdB family regulatory protein
MRPPRFRSGCIEGRFTGGGRHAAGRARNAICRPPAKIESVDSFLAEGIKSLPLYPYCCTQCGHRFEKIQRFKDEPEKVCPKCGGALERPLTAPGLQFKGAGWYVNDYAPKSSAPTGDGAPAEKKPATATKPEAKAETAKEASTSTVNSASSDSGTASSPAKD